MSGNDTSTILIHEIPTTNPSQTIGASIIEDLFEDAELQKQTVKSSAGTSTLALGHAQLRNLHKDAERFTYDTQLGEGAYGKVWKANDIDIGRPVAVKSYKFAGPVGHRLLSMETSIAGKIDHPNVPVLYDIKRTEDEQYHYIMKFIDGESLEEVIKRLRAGDTDTHTLYSFEKRVQIITQILRVLAASHSKNILHRDIKAENIMVGPSGEAYLMDWGVALDMNEFSGEGQLAGSPRYMSPEQAAQKALDARSDLYSISAVFFELMSLKRHGPEADTSAEVLEQMPTYQPSSMHLSMPHKVHGGYPMQYQQIFSKGLQNDPAKRFQSAQEMLQAIESSLSGDIQVGCHVTAMFKGFYLMRQSMIKYPITTNLVLMAAFFGAVGSLIYIGTLL